MVTAYIIAITEYLYASSLGRLWPRNEFFTDTYLPPFCRRKVVWMLYDLIYCFIITETLYPKKPVSVIYPLPNDRALYQQVWSSVF